MAFKNNVPFLIIVLALMSLDGVLAANHSADRCKAEKIKKKMEAIYKLQEVQKMLLEEVAELVSCGGKEEGGQSVIDAKGLENSTIVGDNPEHLSTLTEWLNPVLHSGYHWELCWRASRDGWGASTFHANCDSRGPTVTIVRVAGKYIFGGYTSKSWGGSSGYTSDSSAFLFTLVNSDDLGASKIPVYRNVANAVYQNSGYGPTFGGGHDIRISSDASSNTNSYTNLGHTYEPPNGYAYSTTEAREVLAGTYTFQPDEVETFYQTS